MPQVQQTELWLEQEVQKRQEDVVGSAGAERIGTRKCWLAWSLLFLTFVQTVSSVHTFHQYVQLNMFN